MLTITMEYGGLSAVVHGEDLEEVKDEALKAYIFIVNLGRSAGSSMSEGFANPTTMKLQIEAALKALDSTS